MKLDQNNHLFLKGSKSTLSKRPIYQRVMLKSVIHFVNLTVEKLESLQLIIELLA
ncbi:hypothetical protein [Desulfosporosinus orientis]|uniref:hypothetical protein n=1 Tax=Desulfosporosinus orientis TaxID=1563 RepID=UPI00030364B5|nr:hypothetical protein [Desulfosporosinus orientis]